MFGEREIFPTHESSRVIYDFSYIVSSQSRLFALFSAIENLSNFISRCAKEMTLYKIYSHACYTDTYSDRSF